MLDYPLLIVSAFILFIPAFIANPSAVITGGHYPMDFGKNFPDGRRILGDGKTWSGYFGGSLIGVGSGLILLAIFHFAHVLPYPVYGLNLEQVAVALFAMSFGSLTGDVLGSFIKRRINIPRGGKGSLLDMWPFALVSFLFLYIFARGFFMNYYGNVIGILTILIITPPLHRAVNIIGYRMKRKDVPW
ncbi:MAG: CDP-2,3-bis-(O-geranylgeranyl)-sn-glycerol synthase [Candidatus Thermoplasmatota archaeon]|jgi:CDP-2,3-bis-(O-geranylgeranyl)-sn-glycerol synthase|nr:CDP-2,3-bis-(O-geranylgeranyl)-sn-glycerol synthase [Candidatus Thermoplasmatota archaeon]